MNSRMHASSAAIAALAWWLLQAPAFAQTTLASPTAPAGRSGGIWKAAVPPARMKGEFDNLDPIGIAAGARIEADCSINWIDPDSGARYCFSSGTSLEFFLDSPHANIERARAAWRKLAQRP
jgi:hypothetical protein